MRTYIIENQKMHSERIKAILLKYEGENLSFLPENISLIHTDFTSFIEEQRNMYDGGLALYIFDIELGEGDNGLQLAKILREFDYNSYILFITSHIELTGVAFQYNLKALSFIYKLDSLFDERIKGSLLQIDKEIITKTVTSPNIDEEDYFIYSYKANKYRLPISSIYMVETNIIKRGVIIFADEKEYLYPGTIKEIQEKLGSQFIRTHRSYLVNKQYVREVIKEEEKYKVILTNEFICPVATRLVKQVFDEI